MTPQEILKQLKDYREAYFVEVDKARQHHEQAELHYREIRALERHMMTFHPDEWKKLNEI